MKTYRGYLQADAYPGYDKLYESGLIIEVACWAHARRYFVDAAESASEDAIANVALEHIADLYENE